MIGIAAFLTDFADQAVTLPVSLCAVIGLALAGWRRGAIAYAVAAICVLSTMLALKLEAMGCGLPLPGASVHSPSGHTAAAAAIYGGGLALALRRRLGPWSASLAAALPITIAIGATRLALQVHSPAEVLLGALVGVAGVLGMVFLAGAPPAGLRVWRVALAALAAMIVLHGIRLPAEGQIQWASANIWPFSLCK
jgi:membrane-associated phospholipid phosphatase